MQRQVSIHKVICDMQSLRKVYASLCSEFLNVSMSISVNVNIQCTCVLKEPGIDPPTRNITRQNSESSTLSATILHLSSYPPPIIHLSFTTGAMASLAPWPPPSSPMSPRATRSATPRASPFASPRAVGSAALRGSSQRPRRDATRSRDLRSRFVFLMDGVFF